MKDNRSIHEDLYTKSPNKLCLDLNYENIFTYGKSPHLKVY